MKLTLTSPDGLGDWILRIPMIRSLTGGGHQVQMFLRRPAFDLAPSVFPDVACVEIQADPYYTKTRQRRHPFLPEHQAIRDFGPEEVILGPFGLSFFDQVWIERNARGISTRAFVSDGVAWPASTTVEPAALADRIDRKVPVPAGLPELEKNAAMAFSVTGARPGDVLPQIAPLKSGQAGAGRIQKENRLSADGYWIVCVGVRPGLALKDWGEDNWTQFFNATNDGRPLVFVGNSKECESIERIRAGLARPSVNLAREGSSLADLTVLAAGSCGYIGRDSGIMHLVSALDRPVFALFGGGHWGRFLPSGRGVVVGKQVPCRGCDFACPHERAHCVSDISLPFVVAAWDAFLGKPDSRVVMEEECVPSETARIASVSNVDAREARRSIRRGEEQARRAWWRIFRP